MRRILVAALILTAALPAAAQTAKPWFFAVLSDPQMGMYAKDQNFVQETANLEFVVANLNRLRPRFVVVCGDLVNRTGDSAEIAEYKRILRELDPSIRVHNVAGNHDVENVPTAATLRHYRAAFGPDYYSFREGSIIGMVLDSNLIRSPEKDPKAADQQAHWLERTLDTTKLNSKLQIVVFQHIPYFIHKPDEAENYFNIPAPARRKYLGILRDAGVQYVFAGHLHWPDIGKDGPLTEIVTGATGMPLGGSLSGFRIVTVDGNKLTSTWLCFGGIPNTANSMRGAPKDCPR